MESTFESLLAEAAEWRLLGLLFEYPSESWRTQMEALVPGLRDEALRALTSAALGTATPGLHIALFGPAGSVPVREVTYQGGVQLGYLMAELSAYYEAFGYSASIEEAPDQIAVEAGFISWLKLKQAHALACDDLDNAAITAEAAAGFLKDHLATLAEPVARKLESFAPDYLIQAAGIILRHTGPSPRSAFPLGTPDILEDASEEITCGPSAAGNDLIQLQP